MGICDDWFAQANINLVAAKAARYDRDQNSGVL